MIVAEIYSWGGLATLAMVCWFEFRDLNSTPLSYGEIALACLFWPFTWLLFICAAIGEFEDRL